MRKSYCKAFSQRENNTVISFGQTSPLKKGVEENG